MKHRSVLLSVYLTLPMALLSIAACAQAQAKSVAAPTAREVVAANDRARELFPLGVNAMRAGRFEEARQVLIEAWQLRHTYDVAAALAQVESELGHRARAAELLDFCMNNFAPIESERNLQQLAQVFEQARSYVGKIDLSEVPAGTEVRVDDEVVGTTPLGLPMYLDPGSHRLEFALGDRKMRQLLEVKAGGEYQVLDKGHRQQAPVADARGAMGPTDGQGVKSRLSPGVTRPTFPYVIGASLVLSGILYATANHLEANEARDRAASLTGCGRSVVAGERDCRQLAVANAEQNYYQNLAVFGYGVAATAAIATALYWLWPDSVTSTERANSSSVLTVGCTPTQVWLGAMATVP